MRDAVVILGVFVADTTYRADRAPLMGETILGNSFGYFEQESDDLDAWLQRPSCDAIIARADGSRLLGAPTFDDPRCNAAIERAAVRYGACFEPETALSDLEERMLDAAQDRFDCGDAADGFETCEDALLDLDCAAITEGDPITTIEQTGDACAVFTPRTPE